MSDGDFSFRKLGAESLGEVSDMLGEAASLMPDPTMLRVSSRETLAACLAEPHLTLGAFSGGSLAAFAILYFGGSSGESLARHAGETEEQLGRTANIKLVVVRPQWRGLGLQRELTRQLEREAAGRGIERLYASVSSLNTRSADNFARLGYEKCVTGLSLYGGLARDIYRKTIGAEN